MHPYSTVSVSMVSPCPGREGVSRTGQQGGHTEAQGGLRGPLQPPYPGRSRTHKPSHAVLTRGHYCARFLLSCIQSPPELRKPGLSCVDLQVHCQTTPLPLAFVLLVSFQSFLK